MRYSLGIIRSAVLLLIGGVVLGGANVLVADDPNASDPPAVQTPAKRFSPQVVEKADRILSENGLRRSGKLIKSIKTMEIAKKISALPRQERELRQVQRDWRAAQEKAKMARLQSQKMLQRDADLNLQLANIQPGDRIANNRLVALINANRTQRKLLADQFAELDGMTEEKRSAVNRVESKYEESMLAIRDAFDVIRGEIGSSLARKDVQTALRVSHVNFATPFPVSTEDLIASTGQRIKKLEQAVFREAIPLRVDGGALWVDVVVDRKATEMVVDSGAELVSIPLKDATAMGIKVPAQAPKLRLVMADGRTIPARRVTVPKFRVGSFEAENVETAILDSSALNAVPLLGMSFLRNFRFEIDVPNRQLKLLRIES